MTPSVNDTATDTLACAPSELRSNDRRVAAFLAVMFGISVLFASGFAADEAVHNAAHDARHTFAFPCH